MKKYYVYLLTDPRNNNEVFYCGKGSGDRWKSHLGHWSGNGKNNPTENKIKRIQADNLQPGVIFLYENLEDEQLAYALETAYIIENFDTLTNLKIHAVPPKNTGGRTCKKSENAKAKQSARLKEEYSSGKRKHWSTLYSAEEVSKRISAGDPGKSNRNRPANNRTSIIELTTNKIFESQSDAAAQLNIKQGDISNALNGRQKSVKGYRFEYAARVNE